MRDLLLKLQTGINQETLEKRELKLLFPLIKAGIVKDRPFLKLDHDLVIGTLSLPKSAIGHKKSNGYLQPLGVRGQDLLVLPSDLQGACSGDLVIARFIGQRRGRPAAKVVFVAETKLGNLIGYIVYKGRRAEVLDLDTTLPLPVATKQKALQELPEETVVTIDPKTGEIADILGILSDPAVDEAIVLARYGRIDYFTPEQIQEATSHGMTVEKSHYPDRKDLTHLPFITIDPVDAKDYDDAIYYDPQANVLYVAIADVTAYVHDFGPIDKEARKRGFTVYLPHKSIPMLPRELSEKMCSLQPKVDRLAFTFRLELDSGYNVKHYELYESIIHSRHRYHYDRIDELLEGAKPDDEDKPTLEWLLPLKKVILELRRKRLVRGFSFFNPEIKLELDEHLYLKHTRKAEETLSHQLIEECMLLANCAAAEYFPFGIFRTHEPPDEKNLSELLDNLGEIGIHVSPQKTVHKTIELIQQEAKALGLREEVDRLLIRSLKRAQYTYDNVGHFGLGFEKYTHFTSPIRRYSDLMLHRLLKAILQKNEKQKSYLLGNLQRITPQITLLEAEVAKIEWQYADRAYARWAAEHIGLTLEGEVTEEAASGREAIVMIDDPQIQGMRTYMPVLKKRGLTLRRFERIRAAIATAHLATARIGVHLVEAHVPKRV